MESSARNDASDAFVLRTGEGAHYGVDIDTGGITDTYEAFVWEPSVVKVNAFNAATEAACLVLSVDETIRNPRVSIKLATRGAGIVRKLAFLSIRFWAGYLRLLHQPGSQNPRSHVRKSRLQCNALLSCGGRRSSRFISRAPGLHHLHTSLR